MDCPRCRLGLSEHEYEGQQVHFCGTCWGYWMTRDQLDEIVHVADYSFDEHEVEAIQHSLSKGDADRQGSERQATHCPMCAKQLTRRRFSFDCPVYIDECDAHGLWLDTGEIKDLQVFVESHRQR